MARDQINIEISGRDEILRDLETIGREMPAWVKECLIAQQKVVENSIRDNWVSVAGGRSGDYVYDSVGSSATYGSNGIDVIGTVGVYNLDAVGRAHGRNITDGSMKYRPLNAAQISYWVEFGTSRLRSGQRKKKGREYSEDELITISPKPFLSQAFYGTINEQNDAFIATWNSIMDRMF